MHIVRVSNIMGIESKPFDPKTYTEEEEHFVTDESGHKQRLRLEDNVARWRRVRDRDGNVKVCSHILILCFLKKNLLVLLSWSNMFEHKWLDFPIRSSLILWKLTVQKLVS